MKAYRVITIIAFLFGIYLETDGTTENPHLLSNYQDNTVRVLMLKHQKKDKEILIPAGTPISFWVESVEGNRRKSGMLEGFVEDKVLIVNGDEVPLNKILKIKMRDTSRITALKIFGAIGIGFTLLTGILFSSLLFSNIIGPSSSPSIGLGVLTSLGTLLIVFLISMGIKKDSMKNLRTKYKAEIISISPNELENIK